jgi:hypothetical protein
MIHCLLNGTLSADPVERFTAKKARYATVNLRVPAGPDSTFVGCAASSPRPSSGCSRWRRERPWRSPASCS